MKKCLVFIVIAFLFMAYKPTVANVEWLWGLPTTVNGTFTLENFQINQGEVFIAEGLRFKDGAFNGNLWAYKGPQVVSYLKIHNGVPWVVKNENALAFFQERYQNMGSNNQAKADIRPLPEWNWWPGSTPPSNPPSGEYTETYLSYGDCITGWVETLSNGTWVRQWDTSCGNPLQLINVSHNTVQIRFKTYGVGKEKFTHYPFTSNPDYNQIRCNYASQLGVSTQTVTVRIYSN